MWIAVSVCISRAGLLVCLKIATQLNQDSLPVHMRLLPALVLGAMLCTPGTNGVTQQQPPQTAEKPSQPAFPAVSAYALNKSRMNLPADLAGQSNLLLLSFEREQQKEIDSWLPVAKDLQKTNPSFR